MQSIRPAQQAANRTSQTEFVWRSGEARGAVSDKGSRIVVFLQEILAPPQHGMLDAQGKSSIAIPPWRFCFINQELDRGFL